MELLNAPLSNDSGKHQHPQTKQNISVEGRESMPEAAFFCESELEQPRNGLRVGFSDQHKSIQACAVAERWWQVWTPALPWTYSQTDEGIDPAANQPCNKWLVST